MAKDYNDVNPYKEDINSSIKNINSSINELLEDVENTLDELYSIAYEKGRSDMINTDLDTFQKIKEYEKTKEKQSNPKHCSILNDICAYPNDKCWECPLHYAVESAKYNLRKIKGE